MTVFAQHEAVKGDEHGEGLESLSAFGDHPQRCRHLSGLTFKNNLDLGIGARQIDKLDGAPKLLTHLVPSNRHQLVRAQMFTEVALDLPIGPVCDANALAIEEDLGRRHRRIDDHLHRMNISHQPQEEGEKGNHCVVRADSSIVLRFRQLGYTLLCPQLNAD